MRIDEARWGSSTAARRGRLKAVSGYTRAPRLGLVVNFKTNNYLYLRFILNPLLNYY